MRRKQRAWRRPLAAPARAVIDGAVQLALMDPLPGVDRVAALDRAFALQLPASLPRLAPLALADDPEVAAVAEAGTVALLDRIRSWEFIALDRELRAADAPLGRIVDLRTLTRAANRSAHPGVLLGIAACHPEGRVRASALQTADHWDLDLPLGLLLVRLDDWVTPVRKAARKRVLARLDLKHVPALVAALPLMERLARRSRVQKDKALRWVEQLLRDPEARSGLWGGLESDESEVRRSSVALLAEAGEVDVVRMLDVACSAADPVVAGVAAESVIRTLGAVPDELFASPVARVRLIALRAVADQPTRDALRALHAALMDPRRSVRDAARAHLLRGGATGIAVRYRAKLPDAEGLTKVTALLGLGEAGDKSDLPVLREHLAPDRPSKHAGAALRSIAKLDLRNHLPLIVKHLDDPRPGVAREAREALERPGLPLPVADLEALVRGATHTHGSRHAFRLLARGARWSRAVHLVRGADSTDPWIAERARRALDVWCDAIPADLPPVSGSEADALEAALQARGRGVSDRVAMRMREVLLLARA